MCGKRVILPLPALIGITGILLSAGFYFYTLKKNEALKNCYSCTVFQPRLQKDKKIETKLAVEQ